MQSNDHNGRRNGPRCEVRFPGWAFVWFTAIAWLCGHGASHGDAEELRLFSDFPGGSGTVVKVDSTERTIELAPVAREGRGWPCWWYVRIEGATTGEELTVVVRRAVKEFRPGQRLSANWSLPQQAAMSTDNRHWTHTPTGVIEKELGTYTLAAPAATFWLAWGPPFLPTDAAEWLLRAEERLPSSERFLLAKTLGGNEVAAVRIGDETLPRAIWVQARQHAWESGGSWVGAGFLDWVTSDDAEAAALRRTTQVWFVPIMDVDNVTLGAGGKEALPQDHNRDWSNEPHYPEVQAAQQQLLKLQAAGRLRVYLDLHNPAPADRQPYFYGPFGYEQLMPESRRRYDRFLGLAIEHIRDPLPLTPNYRFATYVQSDEERGRMSSEWVRRHAGPNVVAMTLETAWNTPHSTSDGYLEVGRGLARTVAGYLSQD